MLSFCLRCTPPTPGVSTTVRHLVTLIQDTASQRVFTRYFSMSKYYFLLFMCKVQASSKAEKFLSSASITSTSYWGYKHSGSITVCWINIIWSAIRTQISCDNQICFMMPQSSSGALSTEVLLRRYCIPGLYSYLPLLWSFILPTNMSNIAKEMGKCGYLKLLHCKIRMATNLRSGKIRRKQMTRQ